METNETDVQVEAIIHASPSLVWNAWTDPAIIMQWFGSDPNGRVEEAETDARPGGNFKITFYDSDGTRHTCYGTYKEVIAFSRLTFTWQWKSEPGHTSFIILSFFPDGDSTGLLLEHLNPGTGSTHDYTKGWQSTLAKLDHHLRSLH